MGLPGFGKKKENGNSLDTKEEKLFADGMEAYISCNYKKALRLFEKAAERGHVEAQFVYGRMYDCGEGTTKDSAKALLWVEKAAEQGHSAASYYCGWMYDRDEGTTKDSAKALMWIEKAAEQGHVGAECECAERYYKGEGTEVDKAKAFMWYEKAAEQKNAVAQFRCGWMYDKGEGTAEDKAKALMWYEKAAKGGHVEAQFNCGMMYFNGKGTAMDWERAFIWFEKAAENGHMKAQCECGMMYDIGLGVEEDKARAFVWYGKAAKQGDADAQLHYGSMYSRGEGTAVDKAKGLMWIEKSAQQGGASAQYICGRMYQCGEGVKQDKTKAFLWFQKSAEQGDSYGQFSCGEMYDKGEGTAVDKAKALMWYEKAAEKYNAYAQFNCGRMYDKGEGTAVDKAKALMWYEKAAEHDILEAQYRCAHMYQLGEGTEPDLEKAVSWYEKSFEQKKDPKALYQCGRLYLTSSFEDREKAVLLLAQAVEEGSEEAAKELGELRLQFDIYEILIRQWHIEKENQQPDKGKAYTENQVGKATKRIVRNFSCRYNIFRQYLPSEFLERAYRISYGIGRQSGFWPFIISINEDTSRMQPEELDGDSDFFTIDCSDNGRALLKERFKEAFMELDISPEEFIGKRTLGESRRNFTSFVDVKNHLNADLLLLEVPVKNPWEMIGWLDIDAGNFESTIYCDELTSICKYWYKKYQAVPAVYNGTELEFYAPAKLNGQDSLEAAKEHFAFSQWILWCGRTYRTLWTYAAGIEDSTIWYFFWG